MKRRIEDFQITFRDSVTLMMLAFKTLLVLAVLHMAKRASPVVSEVVSPGNIMIEVHWPNEADDDVDLWVKSPLDSRPVGYSNRGGEQTNLVRDDLGHRGDVSGENYENAITRGVTPGRYRINLHAYGGADYPVKVHGRVCVWGNKTLKELTKFDVILNVSGEEITATSFELDERGSLVLGSVSTEYVPLRAGSPDQPHDPESEGQ